MKKLIWQGAIAVLLAPLAFPAGRSHRRARHGHEGGLCH